MLSQDNNTQKNSARNFKLLLKSEVENGHLLFHTKYADFIEKNKENQILSQLPDEKKEFLFNELKLKLKNVHKEKKQSLLDNFSRLLQDKFPLSLVTNQTTIEDVKKKIKKDPKYLMIPSKTERNQAINDYIIKMKKLKSISTLNSTNVEKLEKDYNVIQFKNLLTSKITSEISYEEAMNKLKNEPQWKLVSDEEKKECFKSFLFNMRERNKSNYVELLEQKVGLNQDITWHDAQHLLQNDPKYKAVQENDRENLFNNYKEDMLNRIIAQFEALVSERADIINKDSPTEGEGFNEIIRVISNDVRAMRMATHPDKRDKIVRNKIRSLKYKFEKEARTKNFLAHKRKKQEENREMNAPWKKGDVIK